MIERAAWIMCGCLLFVTTTAVITASALNITLVPAIEDISFVRSKKICENVNLELAVADEQAENELTFQFPTSGTIVSKDSYVYTAQSFEVFKKMQLRWKLFSQVSLYHVTNKTAMIIIEC
jgi:hypothetical protein